MRIVVDLLGNGDAAYPPRLDVDQRARAHGDGLLGVGQALDAFVQANGGGDGLGCASQLSMLARCEAVIDHVTRTCAVNITYQAVNIYQKPPNYM